MMMTLLRLLVASALCALLVASPAVAQTVAFSASVDRDALSTSDQFQLTFALNGTSSGKNFRPPPLDNFLVLSGPTASGKTDAALALARRLPLPEPRDAHLLRDAPVRALEDRSELLRWDLDGQPDPVGTRRLHGGLHGGRVSETADPSGAARGARRAPRGRRGVGGSGREPVSTVHGFSFGRSR